LALAGTVTLDEWSQAAPALASWLASMPAALHLAWRDVDNHLGMFAWSGAEEPAVLPVSHVSIPCTLALAASGDEVALAWRDVPGLQLARVSGGELKLPALFPDRRGGLGAFSVWLQTDMGFPVALPARSRNAVAVTPTVEGTMLAWTTWRGRIELVPEAGGRFGAQRVLPVWATSAPALNRPDRERKEG
jgi:hypothetical protein